MVKANIATMGNKTNACNSVSNSVNRGHSLDDVHTILNREIGLERSKEVNLERLKEVNHNRAEADHDGVDSKEDKNSL